MKRTIEQAQQDLANELLRRDGVSGVGIGAHGGEPCLKVYVSKEASGENIPNRYEGHRVLVVGGGPFRALDADEGDDR
ncbi:MAG: hypothetical protein R3266_01475 [Gemmatimonadota bacterium]|nr:hypothetical protein [Gemmatimonadota bacterium]